MLSQLNSGGGYQNEYHKLRTKRVHEILKSQNMSNDDFVFLDNFIKTYFPEASKTLKNVLTQEALKKVYQGTEYKELDVGETIFTGKDGTKSYVLVVSGKIDVSEENGTEESNSPLKSYAKNEVINPNDILALSQPAKDLKAVCAEKTEVLVYSKEHYDSVVKEFASAATNTKLKGVAKNFLKIKKMDRSSKEEFLTYFKQEKFTKGTVMVNLKSKIEEIYLIQSGKVALCAPNEGISAYSQSKIIIGVLGPESLFNEWALLFEKAAPYYAVCLEDTELLSLNKANLGFVADAETLNDLRANCQCKQRLQSSFLEKYQKSSKEEIEKSQNKICEKAGIKIKDITDIFEKYDPKSKNSLQFVKNLEKFNKSVGVVGRPEMKQLDGPLKKFSEFATPRLVSKDPNFKNLDPQRQLALMALRNEGANRRAGNVAVPKNLKDMNKDDIMKMQNRLLNEEKLECDKIAQKKTISAGLNLNKATEEEKDSDPDSKKGLFNKMRMDNRQLLANFSFGVGGSKEAKEESANKEEKAPTVNPILAQLPKEEAKQSEPFIQKPAAEGAQKNLANLLNPNPTKIITQNSLINKKRTNLLKNPNLL
jgi:CRP-like cAMP-binding protein